MSADRCANSAPGVIRASPALPVTRRLVCALALVPVVPALSIIGLIPLNEYTRLRTWDAWRLYQLLSSILYIVATVLIWRKAVVWTLRRMGLTALAAMIPFVQVAYGQTWCGLLMMGSVRPDNDALYWEQCNLDLGIWTWLTIWIWWGWDKMGVSGNTESVRRATIAVTPMAKRTAASIGLLPVASGVFWMAYIALHSSGPWQSSAAIASAFGLAAIVAAAGWVLIWGRCVLWSLRAGLLTVLSALLAIGLPIVIVRLRVSPSTEIVYPHFLPVVGWGVWMMWTIWYWPMRADAVGHDPEGPRCLKCGYWLRGLTATRCPECGDEPTLDELWAATALEP